MATIVDRNIVLLSSHDIDAEKWNACIESNHGLVYNRYDYLTIMADYWHGIVVGDYECVLAVLWKRKLGIKYMPVVPFIQQLCILGDYTIQEEKKIVELIEQFVQYGDYNTSSEIPFSNSIVRKRTNFFLQLSPQYEILSSHYKENLQRNIRKAKREYLSLEKCTCQYALDSYAENYQEKIPIVQTVYYSSFRQLVQLLEKEGCAIAYAVRKENNLLATALFIQYENRLYNILPCTLPEGKQYAAMHFLLDKIIELNAGTEMILDFEGSDLPGVKQFYEQFHPEKQEYFQYHINRLPFPLNRIKP